MRFTARKIFWVVLPMAVLLIASQLLAHEQSQSDQVSGAKPALSEPAPDLADIVPSAAELAGRLVTLENGIKDGLDISALKRKYAEIEANLKGPADQLQRLKDSKDYRFGKLVELRKEIEQNAELFEEISKPLSEAIRQLEIWRKGWRTEKTRWNDWQSSLIKEDELDQVKSTFAKAHDTINTALSLILPKLEAMLAVQEKGGTTQAKIKMLTAEVDRLASLGRHSVLLDASPPMFSPRYFSQFKSDLWYAVQKGFDEISWPDKRFFDRLGWVVLLQGLLSLIVIIAVYRNRQVLNDSKRWRFLGARPFSAGLFIGTIATLSFYEYGGIPDSWRLLNSMVGGISFARLLGVLLETSWKRQFVYGIMIFVIFMRLMYAINLPLPLFRIYTIIAALVGLMFFLKWAGDSSCQKGPGLYAWLLRLGSFFLVVIIIAQLLGKEELSEFLFISLILSIALVLVFLLFTYMIHGGLEWLLFGSPFKRVTLLQSNTGVIMRQATLVIDIALWSLVVLPGVLLIWGVYGSLTEATRGVLALSFNLGTQRISVGLLIASATILYCSFYISQIIQALLMEQALLSRHMERGVRLSIGRLVHYVIIFAGFVLALLTLGFQFTELTILLSALGVGIGFGLQGIVNNFVSGLILLFERPVRVGDTIEIGGKWAEIKRIGLRSTTVQTFDQADVIIPNADLVSNQVTNWTLSNRQVRLIIPVGVAYGSDVPLVIERLKASVKENSKVVQTRAPQVLFLGFGESSLDFELRVWIVDADDRLEVKSELHQEIDRSFREAGIVIAFPQQDVHLDGTKPVEIRVVSEDLSTDKK